MEYYPEYSENDFRLYHHGILGMKWGKRNGPPYPLGASDHSASEQRAGWRKSLAERSEARKARKERDSKIQERYEREERDIEKGYKRGQNLSPKDQAREEAADNKARSDWKKSKEQYKSDIQSIKENRKAEKAEVKNQKERLKQQRSTARQIEKNWYKTYNKATDAFNQRIGAINDKHPNANLDNPNSKETKAYLKEVSSVWKKCYDDAISAHYGDTLRQLDIDNSSFPLYNMVDNY